MSVFLRQVAGLPSVVLTMLLATLSYGTVATASGLNVSSSINDQPSSRPGLELAVGSRARVGIAVTNTLQHSLNNIAVRSRQKYPEFGNWTTVCVIRALAAGQTARCEASEAIKSGPHKSLVVATASAYGLQQQGLSDVFYQGVSNATPPLTLPGSLTLSATVNGLSSQKPGPVIESTSALWQYLIRNDGSTAVRNVDILVRQKAPQLGSWRTTCSVAVLQAGEQTTCESTESLSADNFKSLVVARGTDANGQKIEQLLNAFYRPGADTPPVISPPGDGNGSDDTLGYKTLLIGHSFFQPVSFDFGGVAEHAGLTDHQQQFVFSAGDTGAPIRLWNDPEKRAEVTAALDTGNVELLGMTYHDDYPSETGYVKWIDYALQQNSATDFFIGMPWTRNPGISSVSQIRESWNQHHGIVHTIISGLRARYPDSNIYCVPYGMSSAELKALYDAGNLPDVTALIGSAANSLYSDELGHTGAIMKRLSALVWLQALYSVDLSTFAYTDRFPTDLKTIASDIMVVHDPYFNSSSK